MGINRFSKDQQQSIKSAIEKAELQTSCEIKVFVEDFAKVEVLDRAAFQFKNLTSHFPPFFRQRASDGRR